MTRIAILIAACAALGMCNNVWARPVAYISGNELHQACLLDPNQITTYVLGVIEGTSTAEYLGSFKSNYCIPDGTKGSQLRDIACRYLEANPDVRQNPAGSLVYVATMTAYPCPKDVK